MSKVALTYAVVLLAAVLSAAPARTYAQSPAPAADPERSQTPAQHERKRAEREEIERLEQQFQKAQLAGDMATMDRLLSDDYLGVNANGELSTKAQQLDHMRNRTLTLTRLDSSDVKIKLIGSTAIVNSEVQVEGSLDGSPLHGRFRYTRVYQRLPNGTWKITSFEATRIRRPGGPAQS
jgi:ketosteroid isomerase-like protein